MKKKVNGKVFVLSIAVIIAAIGSVVYLRNKPVSDDNKTSSVAKAKKTPTVTTEVETPTPVTTANMKGEAIITLAEDPVTVKVGDTYDANDNVVSVTDKDGNQYQKVEGEVDYSDPSHPMLPVIQENQYFVVNAKVDTSSPGTKSIDVIAIDKNDEYTISNFKVNIIE